GAKLAKVPREQLIIVRAEAVVWNDGSLGCPEPGMQYTQALTNGYWVVIRAAEQTYDFRVDRGGTFRLCPQGRGRPPVPSNAESLRLARQAPPAQPFAMRLKYLLGLRIICCALSGISHSDQPRIPTLYHLP